MIVRGRKLFQEACRLKLSWDEILPQNIIESWNEWVNDLILLKSYNIERCMMSSINCNCTELHLFCDGSEQAYGAVAYLRFDYGAYIETSQVASKSRLTPLNNSTLKTIPRIELCSAKLAVELSLKLQKELQYKID